MAETTIVPLCWMAPNVRPKPTTACASPPECSGKGSALAQVGTGGSGVKTSMLAPAQGPAVLAGARAGGRPGNQPCA